MKEETINNLKKYIDKITKKIKGVSIVLTSKEKNIFEYCTGIVDDIGTTNNPNRMFSIGSNTKLLTAIAIFQLVDNGLLDLDENIKEYIPEFEVQSHKPYDKISIRHILMHRSGLQESDYRLFYDESKTQRDDLLPVIKESFLCSKPGTMYAYSNLGYGLLGIIIERVSEETYIDYLQEHIFDPLELGMKILPTVKDRMNHKDEISLGFNKKRKVVKEDLTTLLAAGSSTYASLYDMANLLRFFLNPKKQVILSDSSMKQLLDTPPEGMYLMGEFGHGLGTIHNAINYYNKEVGLSIGHGGGTLYHFSVFQMIPKQGIGIAIMSNTEDSSGIISMIERKVLSEYLKSIDIKLDQKPSVEHSFITEHLKKYEDTIIQFGTKIPIKLNKNGILETKITFLKAQVFIDENNEYHLKPKGIAKIPLFSETIKNVSLIRKETDLDIVYYGKQYYKHSYVHAALGASKKSVENTQRFKHLQGTYKRTTELKGNEEFSKKAKINITDNEVIFKIKLESTSLELYLYPISSNLFIIQGYGRFALSTVSIKEESKSVYVSLFGITMKKI